MGRLAVLGGQVCPRRSCRAVTGSVVSGFVGGGVTTETINGMTTQYRDDAGTRVAVTVNDASVAGVEVAVRRPPR
jgi:G3E family GTPase